MNQEHKRIFDSLKEDKTELHKNSRVLLIDSLNTFLRSFAVIKHVNSNLNHIGGLTGFLRSLGYAINLIKPTRVILVFDGRGSSTNKRYIYPEYKRNRGITRITNWDMFESQEEESESITSQLVRLVDYLKCLPVDLLSIDKIEADDVIGHITKNIGEHVYIMSSDRDYLQLVSERVTVFSPTKKKFYEPKAVLEEYKVTPENFLTQKVILGDSGDNVPGVKGLGIKTAIKLFPQLSSKQEFSVDEIIKICESGESKTHQSILAFKHKLSINKQLMDLHNPNIPEEALEEIKSVLLNSNKSLDSKTFLQLYHQDQLGEAIKNVSAWLLTSFGALTKYKQELS